MTHDNSNQDTSKLKNKHNFIEIAIDNFKNNIGIPANTKINIINKEELHDNIPKIIISYIGEYPIKANSDEILVSTPLTAELLLDQNKKLIKYQILDPKPDVIQTLKEELKYLMNNNKVKSTNSNDSTSKILSEEFYIDTDNEGKKHLKRSRFLSH